MSEGTTPSDSSTTADRLVRGLVEAMSDSGSKSVPAATTDADEVIRSQLTENTGRHLLDSGSAYGRHWEENQDNPPWEQPAWNVNHNFVTHNVYDFMDRTFDRDEACVALETALYAYAYSDERKRDAWLRCQEDFADSLLAGQVTVPMLTALGVPEEAADTVVGISHDIRSGRGTPDTAMTHNTYNSECHGLSQCLQGTNLGGPYSEYVFLQVHGGCDIRGGYTAPRVYSTWDGWTPVELSFGCRRCGWHNAESCLFHGEENLLYQRTVDREELFEALREETDGDITDDEVREAVEHVADEAEGDEHVDGAVFHTDGGCGGIVGFH